MGCAPVRKVNLNKNGKNGGEYYTHESEPKMTPRKFEQLDDKIKRNMDRDKNTSTKLMTIANDKKNSLVNSSAPNRGKERIKLKKYSNKIYDQELSQLHEYNNEVYKSSNEIKLLKKILKQNSMISSLPDKIITQIIQALGKGSIKKNENLFNENSSGNILYIVISGQFDIIKKNEKIGEYNHDDIIGDMALLHQFLREETVTAVQNSELFFLKRGDFKSIIETYSILTLDEKKSFLMD